VRVASNAISMIGMEGLTAQYPVERIFRDTKLCTIGEGTSEVQCMVIAREMIMGN
jgi:alkylation response protein AidB-like acyl-CoA dehydrogenase